VTEPILEQEQIDQLIEAIDEGKLPAGPHALLSVRHAVPLDLSDPTWSQDRVIRRRLPVLDLVAERLAPAVQVTLTKSLRSPVRAEGISVELQKFGDFRRRLEGRRCLFEVMRLDPLAGSSMLVMAPTMTYALIDALMGGLGIADIPEDREISDIEIGVLSKVHIELLRDFENAWRSWFPLSVEHVRTDRDNQVISTLGEGDVCHVGTISLLGDVLPVSPLYFILPYTNLEPLFEATSARAGEEVDPNWRANLQLNLLEIQAAARAVLADTELSAAQIRSLQVGQVIELDKRIDQDMEIRVEGESLFKGRIGKSHSKYALRISERREIERSLMDRTAGHTLVRKGLISHEQLAVVRVDERINRRPLLDSIVARGWLERRVLENALGL
jgi:flagellar motor switch protein FliM